MEPDLWPDGVEGPAADVLRLVRAQAPDVVVERPDGDAGGACFAIRLAGSLETVEFECQPAGRPPFVVSDEYSWAQVDAPVAAAEAVLGLLRA